MVIFAIFAEGFMENIHDGLNGVIQENVWVVASDQFIADYDQFWVVFDVSCIHCAVVGTDWELYLLKGVVERVFEEISDLVLWFVEYFLQTLQKWFDLLPSSVQPFLEHWDSFLFLLISLIELAQTSIQEKFLSNQFSDNLNDLFLCYVMFLSE